MAVPAKLSTAPTVKLQRRFCGVATPLHPSLSALALVATERVFYYVTVPSDDFMKEWRETQCLKLSLDQGSGQKTAYWGLREARV